MTRKLDHLVLPVAGLASARHRLTSLGFTVAPDGRHPFGTANCCVYFSDDTFIEPLAVVDQAEAAGAIRAGNVFVTRDHVFRSMIGDEGLSAVVLQSADAAEDHQRFERAGIGLGDLLTFSRSFTDANGDSGTATFRLAFAASPDVADAFLFSCERVNAPKVDRSSLTAHANGATAISRIVVDPDASAFMKLVGEAAEAVEPAQTLGDTTICAHAGPADESGKTVTAVAYRVTDLHVVEKLLVGAAVDFQRGPVQIVVPPAPGQGVHFIFEADK